MDSTTVQRLTLAYLRRQQWQNKAMAAEVVGLLGQAMGGTPAKAGPPPARSNWVSGGELLGMMGVTL